MHVCLFSSPMPSMLQLAQQFFPLVVMLEAMLAILAAAHATLREEAAVKKQVRR